MDPITISAILALPGVKSAVESLGKEAAGSAKKSLIRRLHPTEREKAAKDAISLFVEEWDEELEATAEFHASIRPLREQLKRLVETAAAEIAEWMDPETREVDLSLLASTWSALKLDPLPEDFSWVRVAQNYLRAIKKYIKARPELRAAYDTALNEEIAASTARTAEAAERAAGPDPGFDLDGYRQFLVEKKCNALQLAVMHSSTYEIDRKITLWSIFVPQSARESAPILEIPPEIQRRLREEGHITHAEDEEALDELRERYQSSPLRPVLEILNPDRNRLVALVGDPGSGKSSLLRYLALKWAIEDSGPIPILVDLKEYAKEHNGILEYIQFGRGVFRLNAKELRKQLLAGSAAFYLDGLDEIFEASTRQAVVTEIGVLSATFSRAPIFVTTRKVGYEPEELRNAGFLHATLEEFDHSQMLEFLRQWHHVAEQDDEERDLMQTRLERALGDSQAVRELAGNPLLLTMMAILNRNQELPRNRVALYREASRVLLDDWDAKKTLPVSEFDREDKEALLRDLAGEMQQAVGGLAGNLIEESSLTGKIQVFLQGLSVQESRKKSRQLVKQLTERNFILAYAGANRFAFVHRTFLEYYCALWFVDRFQKKQDLTLQQLKEDVFGLHWKDERWHEVLRLIVGMVEERKAEELILYLIDQKGGQNRFSNHLLAAGCLSEIRNRGAIQSTGDALWNRLVALMATVQMSEPTAEAATRMMSSVWKGEKLLVWLRSAAEFAASSYVAVSAIKELCRTWKDEAGTLPSIWSIARSHSVGPNRMAAIEQLVAGWPNDPELLPWLKEQLQIEKDDFVRRAAIEGLAILLSDKAELASLARDRLQNDEEWFVRSGALSALCGEDNVGLEDLELIKRHARSDESKLVRAKGLRALSTRWGDDPDTLPILIDRLTVDESEDVRELALALLSTRLGSDSDLRALFERVAQSDPAPKLRKSAIRHISRNLDNVEEAADFFQSIANDEDEAIRILAVEESSRVCNRLLKQARLSRI